MPVTGFGGLFFRASDPERLTAWYRETLGIGPGCDSTGMESVSPWSWSAGGGPTIFAPFDAESDYFAPDKAFMINLRVSGSDALLAQLQGLRIAVETRAEWGSPETGRFARIHDPEGNAIELWQPPAN